MTLDGFGPEYANNCGVIAYDHPKLGLFVSLSMEDRPSDPENFTGGGFYAWGDNAELWQIGVPVYFLAPAHTTLAELDFN